MLGRKCSLVDVAESGHGDVCKCMRASNGCPRNEEDCLSVVNIEIRYECGLIVTTLVHGVHTHRLLGSTINIKETWTYYDK